jgi:hypothetical protein
MRYAVFVIELSNVSSSSNGGAGFQFAVKKDAENVARAMSLNWRVEPQPITTMGCLLVDAETGVRQVWANGVIVG